MLLEISLNNPDERAWRRGVFAAALALLLLIVAAPGCRRAGNASASKNDAKEAAEPETAPTVSVARVRTGTIETSLPLTGTLAVPISREAAVAAPVAGTIDLLPVRFGQTVRRGQVIVHLSTRALAGQIAQARATIAQNAVQVQQAQTGVLQQQGQTRSAELQAASAVSAARANLAGAEATLTGAEAALANAQQSRERSRALFAEGLVAKKDVEAADLAVRSAEALVAAQRQTVAAQRQAVISQQQALAAARTGRLQDAVKRGEVAIARQQLQGARGALANAQAQAALYTVRAPLSGVVTVVGASLGETVDPATKIVTISDLDRLELRIAVPSASAATVRAGQTVTFSVDALPGRTFRSVLRVVGTQVDPATSTITAIADVDNRAHRFKDDLLARVRVVAGRHANARLVPRAAVLYDTEGGGDASVSRIDAAGVLHNVPITTGFVTETTVEALSGVQAGDRVATTGAYGLPDNTKVQVRQP